MRTTCCEPAPHSTPAHAKPEPLAILAARTACALDRAFFGEDKDKLKAWLRSLVRQLENESAVKVIRQLEEVMPILPEGAAGAAVAREVNCFREHEDRMDYRAARRAGEPIGSGPVEATCRQYPCCFKRPGLFWSREGDEALMCLETFWRNDRWHLLFPPAFNPAKN
jgi:hypothetical protein